VTRRKLSVSCVFVRRFTRGIIKVIGKRNKERMIPVLPVLVDQFFCMERNDRVRKWIWIWVFF
jgi:site-specific recombinase XerD